MLIICIKFVTKNGLWVTGGLDSDFNRLDTTEIIFLNGSTQPGPNLSVVKSSHCLTKHEDIVYLIGGHGGSRKSVWRFDASEDLKQIEDGPTDQVIFQVRSL